VIALSRIAPAMTFQKTQCRRLHVGIVVL